MAVKYISMKSTNAMFWMLVGIVSVSCSSFKQQIKKNDRFTDDMIGKLFKTNQNVFYARSTNYSFSTVWSFSTDSVKVYELLNGKINGEKAYAALGMYELIRYPKQESKALVPCMELDGDMLGYKIKRDTTVDQEDLSVNIKCFIAQKHDSPIINKMVTDIKDHHLLDDRYIKSDDLIPQQ